MKSILYYRFIYYIIYFYIWQSIFVITCQRAQEASSPQWRSEICCCAHVVGWTALQSCSEPPVRKLISMRCWACMDMPRCLLKLLLGFAGNAVMDSLTRCSENYIQMRIILDVHKISNLSINIKAVTMNYIKSLTCQYLFEQVVC